MPKFVINFTEKKKYNPATREVVVTSATKNDAILVFTSHFDTFKFHPKWKFYAPSGKRVTINSITELELDQPVIEFTPEFVVE